MTQDTENATDDDREGSRARSATTDEIVVGVDGGAASAAALGWAAEQSRTTGAPLHVLYSWQLKASQVEAAGVAFRRAAATDARARATRWVIDALGPSAATCWALGIVEGPPGPALVARSRDAALLVVGTGEHAGLRRLVTGSVSHYALSHAVPPVVAVRARPVQLSSCRPSGTSLPTQT